MLPAVSRRRARPRALLASSSIAVSLFLATPSHAAAAKDETEKENAEAVSDEKTIGVGLLGGVGFPRPLAIEGVLKVDRRLMLGLEYGVLPKVTIASVETNLWSLAADTRFFPFKGSFFVGLRGGLQHIDVGTTLTAAQLGSYSESVAVDTWFINPRVGFLWRFEPFVVGLDAGVQVPLTASVTRKSSTSVSGLDFDAHVTDAADSLGKTVLPTIDILRVGIVL